MIFVSEKLTVAKLLDEATTLYVPAFALAVHVIEAFPLESALTAVVLDGVQLAPEEGALNVTGAPETGLPN
jgi:hypothetical protein